MKTLTMVLIVAVSSWLSGCGTNTIQNIQPPSRTVAIQNTIILPYNKDILWNKLVLGFSKSFFRTDMVEKDAGIISFDFSNNSGIYIDCGKINIKRWDNTPFHMPGATPRIVLNKIIPIIRTMNLSGRINIVAQSIDATHSQLTVNALYNVTQRISIKGPRQNSPLFRDIPFTETVTFTTYDVGKFTSNKLVCQSNGKLESLVLSLIKD